MNQVNKIMIHELLFSCSSILLNDITSQNLKIADSMTKKTVFYIFNPSSSNPVTERSALAGALRQAVSSSTCYGASDIMSAQQYLASDAPHPTAYVFNTVALRDSIDVQCAVSLLQRHEQKSQKNESKPLVFLLARNGACDAAMQITKESGLDVYVLNEETLKSVVAQNKLRSANGLRKFCTQYKDSGTRVSAEETLDY